MSLAVALIERDIENVGVDSPMIPKTTVTLVSAERPTTPGGNCHVSNNCVLLLRKSLADFQPYVVAV